MNKAELVERVAQRCDLSLREARGLVDAIFDPDPSVGLIARELVAGRKVTVSGFGTFETRPRRARVGRNPQTGEVLSLPASRAPAFSAGKPLKEAIRAGA
jgi:DNA-binding protein HU-beta